MSRFYDDGEQTMPYDLWLHNIRAAIKGKRGQAILRDLREALLSLPEKRLIEGAICNAPSEAAARPVAEFCAVGALAFYRGVKSGKAPADVIESLPQGEQDDWTTIRLGRSLGMSDTLAWDLAYKNDETFADLTPEQRYEKYLAWVESQILPVPA